MVHTWVKVECNPFEEAGMDTVFFNGMESASEWIGSPLSG